MLILFNCLPKERKNQYSKRHLIGNVIKASDGSLQLFSDLKSHIGTNKTGCCGRSFVTNNKEKEPIKNSLVIYNLKQYDKITLFVCQLHLSIKTVSDA